jgi:hypothetical protein
MSKLVEAIAESDTKRKEDIASLPSRPSLNGIVPKKQKTIAVCTPTLGVIPMWWFASATSLVFPMNMGKAFFPIQDLERGEVGQMRNRLVNSVLEAEKSRNDVECEYIFWLDDDVIIHHMALMSLLSWDRDVAAGVYFCKGHFGEPLLFPAASGGTLKYKPWAGRPDDEARGIEMYGYPQGLSLVRTSVYKRMRDEMDLGVDKYGSPCWYKQPEFAVDPKTGGLITGGTEDFHFFENLSKLGIRPIVDTSKFAFGFHYSIQELVAYPVVQWEQYVKRQPIVWPAPAGELEVVWK